MPAAAVLTDVNGIPWTLGQIPPGAVWQTKSSGNVAAAVGAATIAKVAGKTTYLVGFEITGTGATVGLPVTVTITGLLGGTASFTYAAVADALLANTPLIRNFPYPLPSSDVNVDIVVSCPSLGTGATNNTVVAYGYTV
jgi:hypothetical protein